MPVFLLPLIAGVVGFLAGTFTGSAITSLFKLALLIGAVYVGYLFLVKKKG